MEALVDYAKTTFKDPFNYVSSAIGRGWDVFNHDVYLTQVLSHTKILNLGGTQVSDVSALSALSQLKTLNLSGTQVSDVSALKQLKNLTVYTDDENKAKQWKSEGLDIRLQQKT